MSPWEDSIRGLRDRAAGLAAAGLHRDAAAVLNEAGLAALEGGLLNTAGELFERVAVAFEAEGYETEASAAQTNLALVATRIGALDEAERRYRRSLVLLARAAERDGHGDIRRDLQEADVRVDLGVLYRRRNDLEAAAEEYRRAQEVYRRHDRRADVLDVEANLAVLDDRAGCLGEARRRLMWVREQLVRGRDDRALARTATTLAAVAGQEGRFGEATTLLEEARETYSALHLPRELAEVLTNQGYVLMHMGDVADSGRHRAIGQAAPLRPLPNRLINTPHVQDTRDHFTGSIPVSPTEERPGQKLTASRLTRPFVVIGLVAGAFPEQSPRRSLAVLSPGSPACCRCSARTTSTSQPPRPPTVKGPLGVSGSRGRSGADGDLEPGEEIRGRVLGG